MKVIQNKVLGLSVPVEVPSDFDELSEMCGTADAALDLGIYQVLYQAWNSRFRSQLCKAIKESEFGIEWPQRRNNKGELIFEEGKDENGKTVEVPVLVTEKDFFDFARPKLDAAWLHKTSLAVAKKITFAECVQVKRGSKPTKDQQNSAEKIYDSVMAGNNTAARVEEVTTENTGQPLSSFGEVDWKDREVMVLTLARAVKAYEDKLDAAGAFS